MVLLENGEVLTCGSQIYLGNFNEEIRSVIMDPPYPDTRRQTLHFRPVSSLLGISISEIAAGPQGTFAREAGTGAVYSFGYDILGRPEPDSHTTPIADAFPTGRTSHPRKLWVCRWPPSLMAWMNLLVGKPDCHWMV